MTLKNMLFSKLQMTIPNHSSDSYGLV